MPSISKIRDRFLIAITYFRHLETKRIMTIKDHFRKNIVLATPVIIGQLGHIMVSVADQLWWVKWG